MMTDIKYTEEGKLNEGECAESVGSGKTVLLIGDSIRQGYCGYVKDLLQREASVVYPTDNCRNTQYTYVSLANWRNLTADPEQVAVVYWNNGHWDAARWGGDAEPLNTPRQYGDMLVRIYRKIRQFFPNAVIVFATTTPVNPNGSTGPNPRANEDISRYNEVAKDVLGGTEVIIDDLYELYKGYDESYYSDYCHLSQEGYRIVAAHVADTVRKFL